MTANQDFFNANVRRGVSLERNKRLEAGAAILLLDEAIVEMEVRVRRSLNSLVTGRDRRGSKRLASLLAFLKEARKDAFKNVNEEMRSEMLQLAKDEAAFQAATAISVIPITLDLVQPTEARLRAATFGVPFHGLNWAKHIKNLETQDFARIQAAVRLGFVQGESTDQVVARLFGTDFRNRRDGALAVTRRHLDAVVRSAFNHVANQAREEMWDGNADIIRALRWTSVLDGRTSPICRARSAHMAPTPGRPLVLLPGERRLIPPGARPPAHFRCRSVMIAVLDGIGIVGTRPFVRDTRTRRVREIDFRREAKESAGDSWSEMSAAQRRRAIQGRRVAWSDDAIGEAPAAISYDEWLRTQPRSFQIDVLGRGRADLFRDGLNMDEFVDFSGKEFTLADLRETVS